jgi:hypothetical protein
VRRSSRLAAPAWTTSSRWAYCLQTPPISPGLSKEYARWFPSVPPTRYVAKLGVDLPGLLVSIRMTVFVW